jgi:hypothetical protein
MKKMTCSQIGGPDTCEEEFEAGSANEMVDTAWGHLQAAHPEMAQNIMNNPKEENDKWMEEFKQRFEALPEGEA